MTTTAEKRRSARQTSLKPSHIFIGNDAYPLANVSREGIGIQIEERPFFLSGTAAGVD